MVLLALPLVCAFEVDFLLVVADFVCATSAAKITKKQMSARRVKSLVWHVGEPHALLESIGEGVDTVDTGRESGAFSAYIAGVFDDP